MGEYKRGPDSSDFKFSAILAGLYCVWFWLSRECCNEVLMVETHKESVSKNNVITTIFHTRNLITSLYLKFFNGSLLPSEWYLSEQLSIIDTWQFVYTLHIHHLPLWLMHPTDPKSNLIFTVLQNSPKPATTDFVFIAISKDYQIYFKGSLMIVN
jgi:hypothetical protein